MNKAVLALVAVFSAATVFAGTKYYTVKDGVSDWSDESSFEPAGSPTAEDVIYLESGRTVHLSATDAASVAAFGRGFSIWPKGTGRIIVDVPDAASPFTITNQITSYFGGNAGYCPTNGVIVKTGSGTLVLDAKSDVKCHDTGIEVREGIVKAVCAQGVKPGYGFISISNNAAFYLPANCGYCSIEGLWGDGLLTTEGSAVQTRVGRVRKNKTTQKDEVTQSWFYGTVDAGIYWFSQGGCHLMGTNNRMTSKFTIYYGKEYLNSGIINWVRKFGNTGDATSSIGATGTVEQNDGGGNIGYEGLGERTDKKFTVWADAGSYMYIDGGTNGNLTLTGKFETRSSNNLKMGRIALGGENKHPCTIAGDWHLMRYVGSDAVNYTFHLLKIGSGAWRFADTALNTYYRTWDGGIAVREGTLQFDSLDNRGIPCSLGTALNLNDGEYAGAYDPSHDVDYAFRLGGIAASANTEGTLEFVGSGSPTNSAWAENRTAVLDGNARFKNDQTGAFRFRGVRSKSAWAKTLTLDGTSENADNMLADVTDDGAGAISVVKEGAGTWKLSGTNSFHGALAVKAGKLVLSNVATNKFTWFRWTIRQVGAKNTYAEWAAQEFCLYGADNKRVNSGLVACSNYAEIAVGEAAYQRRGRAIEDYGYGDGVAHHHLGRLFDDRLNYPGYPDSGSRRRGTTSIWELKGAGQGNLVFDENDPTSYIPILMRLDPSIAPVDHYDIVKGNAVAPSSWTLEGSPDGLHWKLLDDVTGFADVSTMTAFRYYYLPETQGEDDGTAATHAQGPKIAGNDADAVWPMLNNVSTVSVAAGATLEVEGPAIAVSHVTLNAAGAGTFKNLAFPENGTIDVTGLDPSAKKTTIVPTYEACDTANMAGWSLTIDGQVPKKHSYTITEDGKVTIWKNGLAIIIR